MTFLPTIDFVVDSHIISQMAVAHYLDCFQRSGVSHVGWENPHDFSSILDHVRFQGKVLLLLGGTSSDSRAGLIRILVIWFRQLQVS